MIRNFYLPQWLHRVACGAITTALAASSARKRPCHPYLDGMIDHDPDTSDAQTISVERPFKPSADGPCDSDQDDELGLKIDHNDPLAWINFWPG